MGLQVLPPLRGSQFFAVHSLRADAHSYLLLPLRGCQIFAAPNLRAGAHSLFAIADFAALLERSAVLLD